MGPHQIAGGVERGQVGADGDGRHVEMADQLLDGDPILRAQHLEDLAAALLDQWARVVGWHGGTNAAIEAAKDARVNRASRPHQNVRRSPSVICRPSANPSALPVSTMVLVTPLSRMPLIR